MDLCTQAHDIIRTWLFSRVVRAHFENHALPWSHAMISGFILDPDRKKMTQVQGQRGRARPTILDKYGSDAVRWRAAMARPGLDSPFDETQMKVGRRLAMKVLNASKFVLGSRRRDRPRPGRGHRAGRPGAARRRCAEVVDRGDGGLRGVRLHARALEAAEQFFWEFCDDYLELVKERAYGADGGAAADVRAARRWPSRCTSSCGCSRRSCPTSPKRSGRGGRRARSTAPPGRRVDELGRAAATRRCSTTSPRR